MSMQFLLVQRKIRFLLPVHFCHVRFAIKQLHVLRAHRVHLEGVRGFEFPVITDSKHLASLLADI